ncbi:DUF6230 family protein [Streptomyces polyrhachis]|uniref:DUF6230 family protein n=1 Tax=Streptomyces polyrhachis TaxID=1282885 RepID=A0ABW2GMP1_9ACTN
MKTSSLYGIRFGAAVVDQNVTQPDGTDAPTKMLRLGFAEGVINNLCISQQQQIGALTYTVLLRANDNRSDTWEIRTKNTVLDVRSATGILDMDGLVDINVNGQDVKTIQENPDDPASAYVRNPLGSTADYFGIQARYAKLDQITSADVHDIQIPGIMTAPNLSVEVKPGTVTCPAPPAPTGTPGSAG